MSQQTFILKNAKQRLTRQLNALMSLMQEADAFEAPWNFPTQAQALGVFLISKGMIIKNLMSKMQQRREDIVAYYAECNGTIHDLAQELKVEIENQFDEYWSERKGEDLLQQAEELERQLERRLLELQCQEASLKHELTGEGDQGDSNHSLQITQQQPPSNTWALERRLMGNELKVPNFYGTPSEFDSFWEMFEELFHHQPYSNIEKLSILINCCKGDAARTLQMIPRTGESYERAINQLKSQYQDPRRVTMQMIRKLKSMKQCQDDHRSLRNNLNDIQAIIATLEKQGEAVNTTNMRTMVLETFSKNVQDEMARKEFDSGSLWSMTDLIENLTIAIKRKEHVESIREIHQSERSIFHTRTTMAPRVRCTGCGQPHKFQYCDKYSNAMQKIGRLRELNACWKCFSLKHHTQFCRKQNCVQCGGQHHLTLCRLNQQPQHDGYANIPRRRYNSSMQREREQYFNQARQRKQYSSGLFKSRSYSPNRPFHRNRTFNPHQNGQSPRRSPPRSSQRSSPRPRSRIPLGTPSPKHSPSPSRTPERQVRFSQSPRTRKRSFENVTVNLQVQESTSERYDNDEFTTAFTSSNNVRLMIVPVQIQPIQGHDKETVFAILDSASDQSFISTSLAQRMKLKIQSETTVVVNTFGGRAEKRKAKRVITYLYNAEGDFIKTELLTNDKITPPLQVGSVLPQDVAFIQENFADGLHLKNMSQAIDGTVVPEILIGMDYFNAIMKLNEPVIRLPSGFFLTPTFFGPVISGVPHSAAQCPEIGSLSSQLVHSYTVLDSNKNDMDMTALWKLNTIGIEDVTTDEEINNQIVSEFYSSVQIHNGKIFVRFPWKPNKKRLASNYNLALSRLHQLFKMRERNPQCWDEYCNIIQEQLKRNFIEDAPRPQANSETPCYYIPHQAVIKSESVTTKTRIVLDASSKMKGELSLNDVIHQGPLILPNLCGVLIRSRVGSKIMIADVEKAFHMIHLQETERDAVRFLWLQDITKPPTPDNIRILRFCRLPFGINASPFLLGISIKYGIEQQSLDEDFKRQLNDNLYVDNVLLTDDSTQSLIKKYQWCKQAFNNMTMNLRQFLANDNACNKSIAPSDLSNSKSTKILGIPWDNQKDTFSIKCKLQSSLTLTKRKVLQAAHSTFDPLGLLIPLLLPAKLFLQDLWKRDFKWDEALPEELSEEWRSICEHAAGFNVPVPRVVTDFAANNRYELLTFVDASTRSFAAAAYLRTIDVSGTIRSHLLMARQRLAPITKSAKTTTIPRLELLALLIGIRLTNFIVQEIRLPLKEIYVLSDSQVALNWVHSNNKNGVFVDNRCSEIRSRMESWSNMGIVCHLQYIPSEMNPVDCATKGLTKDQIVNHMWWTGPPFLLNEHSKWPKLPQYSWKIEESGEEIDSSRRSHTVCVAKSDTNLNSKLFSKEYSSIKKYKRILCLILKFLKHVLYNKISNENKVTLRNAIPEIEHVTTDTSLTTMEPIDLSMAERVLIKRAQKEFSAEYLAKLNNLQLYTDENGVIRCRGRIQAKHLAKETQEPILLPENHNFTTLIIKDTHHRCGHQGINGTLANLRLNYWIPKGRQTVKKCLRTCLTCKKWNSKPFFYPNSPPLPQARTEPSRPFLHVGIDLAGPFRVLSDENGEQKRWILLSTCMVTRAIHLEIVNNLSAAEFINGLRRFVARRGKPKLIISDNATNFVLGREIIETLNDRTEIAAQTVQNYLSNEGIKWKFITPLSPWKGGFYERMVGIMKSTLKRITRRKSIHENEFTTVIPECEAMVNSRPLTYSGSTVEDSVILRPIDFIIPYANVNLLPSIDQDEEDGEYFTKYSTKEETIQLFQKHLGYLQKLWEFWTDNYLLELRNYHQTRINQKSFTRKQPYIGEVVLVMDESKPRGEWPLGLVTKLIKDQDGEIRSVELKTAKSDIERSINLLIPLEIEERNRNQQENNKEKSIQDESSAKAPQESVNDGTVANFEVMTPQHNDAAKRTRPWLPRRAKERVNYCVNAIGTQTTTNRSMTVWQRWLTLALVASLCTSTQSKESKENIESVVQCTKGGVIVQMPQVQDKIHVCGNDYCLEIENPDQNIKVQFPAEITLHSYHVLVKTLLGNSTQAFHWACSPSPFCEQIDCTFCSPMVTNPECWPRLAIMLVTALLYIILITVYLILRTVSGLCRGCKNTWNKLNIVGRCLSRREVQRRPSREYIPLIEINNDTNRKWKTSTIIRLLTVIALCQGIVHGCEQVLLIPSTIAQCRGETCHNHTTVIAKFNSMQSELCLQVKHEDFQKHMMKITMQEMILRCQKETLYFTQDTRTHVQHSKRCPHKGSCVGLKCAGISPDSLVKELDIANNFTGITYCTESCGGLGCSCGFPSSGCLFYRVYHVPTDESFYEVFRCSSWYETIRFKVEYADRGQNNKIYTGEIKPYTNGLLGRTRIEVTSFSFSPIFIQYKQFITNNKTTAYLDDDTTFSYACPSIPATSNFSINHCSIRDTCKCHPAEDSVSCYCTHNTISQTRRLSHTLPLPLSNGIVVVGPKHLPIIRTSAVSIETGIHIDPSILELAQDIAEFSCNIIPKPFIGCYSCSKGAIAKIHCKTDVKLAHAQVTCGIRQFVLTCAKEGFQNEIRLYFNRARVKEQCQVKCGSQVIIMEIQGELNYINGINPIWKYTRIFNNHTKDDDSFTIEWDFPDINHFFEICRKFYLYTLAILIGFSSLVAISVAHLCASTTKKPTQALRASISSLSVLQTNIPLVGFIVFKKFSHIVLSLLKFPFKVLSTLLRRL